MSNPAPPLLFSGTAADLMALYGRPVPAPAPAPPVYGRPVTAPAPAPPVVSRTSSLLDSAPPPNNARPGTTRCQKADCGNAKCSGKKCDESASRKKRGGAKDPGGRAALLLRLTTLGGDGDYDVVVPGVPAVAGGFFGGGAVAAVAAGSVTRTLTLPQATSIVDACEFISVTIMNGGRRLAVRARVSTPAASHRFYSQVEQAIASTIGSTDQALANADTAFAACLQNPAALTAAGGMSLTQVANLINRFVTQRISRDVIKTGPELFKIMANETAAVKANFLKYAAAMKYADTPYAQEVMRRHGHKFAMQFNFN